MNSHRWLTLSLMLSVVLVSTSVSSGSVVFSDNFLLPGSFPGTTWTVSATGGSAANVVSGVGGNVLQLSNGSFSSGRVQVSTPTTSFSSPYNSILSSNPGLVSWSFNMQQDLADPSGFGSGNSGVAFVLAATTADFTTADGYAVALGNSGGIDSLRLVRFAGGLDADGVVTNILSSSTDADAQYASVKVTYNPASSLWAFFTGDYNNVSFPPSFGTLTFHGTATDSILTGTNLPSLGALWQFNSFGPTVAARFDNITVDVATATAAVPEAGTLFTVGGLLGLYGLVAYSRRRFA